MKSVIRSLQVLETLANHQPAGVSALSRTVSLPVSTVQRILITLEDAGWVMRTDSTTSDWKLTNKALVVARQSGEQLNLLDACGPPMRELRDATQSTIYLAVPDGPQFLVVVHRVDSRQQVRAYTPLGRRGRVIASSAGRSLLAAQPDEVIDALISDGLGADSSGTPIDPHELINDIRLIRERDYAISNGRSNAGYRGISSSVTDDSGAPIAAVTISVPKGLFSTDMPDWMGPLVAQTAAHIKQRLDGA